MINLDKIAEDLAYEIVKRGIDEVSEPEKLRLIILKKLKEIIK